MSINKKAKVLIYVKLLKTCSAKVHSFCFSDCRDKGKRKKEKKKSDEEQKFDCTIQCNFSIYAIDFKD
jgi:hypothetical protein